MDLEPVLPSLDETIDELGDITPEIFQRISDTLEQARNQIPADFDDIGEEFTEQCCGIQEATSPWC